LNITATSRITFEYLDAEDRSEFVKFLGTDFEDMLTAGSRTGYREKYPPEQQYYRIRVILMALARDFNLPAVRCSNATAATLYSFSLAGNDISPNIIEIVDSELVLLIKHLQSANDDDEASEKDCFERGAERWHAVGGVPAHAIKLCYSITLARHHTMDIFSILTSQPLLAPS
jgi:hypothetical protein